VAGAVAFVGMDRISPVQAESLVDALPLLFPGSR